MKVLYFHQYFTLPTQAGGTRSYEMARQLLRRGHTVTMVCGETVKLNLPATKSKYVYRGIIDGIDIIQISLPYSNNDSLVKRAITLFNDAAPGIAPSTKQLNQYAVNLKVVTEEDVVRRNITKLSESGYRCLETIFMSVFLMLVKLVRLISQVMLMPIRLILY
jgi:hypothetical protein